MSKIFGIYDKNDSIDVLKKKIIRMHNSIGIGSLDSEIKKNYATGHVYIPNGNVKGIAKNYDVIICFSGRICDYEKDIQQLKEKGHELSNDNIEEFILHAYMEYSLDFVYRLNGQFVISIYDSRIDAVFIINDRFGIKPLYYYVDHNKLVFGSEIKTILTDKKITRKINWDFWKDVFAYRFPLGIKTPYNGIESLPNASILKYNNGKCTIHKYWDYDKIKINYERSEKETIRQGVQLLRELFHRQTKGLRECTVLLSGGYDSRCIIASLKKFTNIKIHAYTIAKSYPTPQKESGDLDTKYSQQVCDALGIDYIIIGNNPDIYKKYFVKHIMLLDGITSESLWIMPLFDQINGTHVSFDGILGDIFLRDGWLSVHDIANPKMPITQYATNLHNYMIKEAEVNPKMICEFFDKDIRDIILPNSLGVEQELSKIPEVPYRIKIFHLRSPTKNIHSLISNNVISRKTDTVYPFCDNHFAEFALSIPPKMKVNNIYFKILEKAFPDIMKIPTTNDPKNLKERIYKNLGNVGFRRIWHSARSLKKGLSRAINKNDKSIVLRRYSENPRDIDYLINLAKSIDMPKYIKRELLLKKIDEHISNDNDPSYFLEPIMHFCIWYNEIYGKSTTQ